MKLITLEISVEGITPLILHNSRTASPLDKYNKLIKQITSKRKKTDEDHEEILKLQWEASLYWEDKLGVYMPWENVFAMLLKAAKKHKFGPKMCAFDFSKNFLGFPITFPNSKNLEKLKADSENKFVKLVNIQRSKTLTCRPIFKEWALTFSFDVNVELVDLNEVKTIIATASEQVGMGEWRASSPTPGPYGKFTIKKITKIEDDKKTVLYGG